MTPWDLIVWALAAAAAIVIVGLAITIVLICINGVRDSRTTVIPANLQRQPSAVEILRGRA